MNCPYCAEQIKDAAIVCRYCQRDLFVIRPLMEKLAEATKRLEALEAGGPIEPGSAPASFPKPATVKGPPSIDPVSALTLTFILLLGAHYVIIVEYSLPLIDLRVASIVIPLVFGFLCRESGQRTMIVEFLYGVLVAVASILAMSLVVGKIDKVPVLPRDGGEWLEFAEYGASIAFGFFTGVVVRQTLLAAHSDAKPNWLIGMTSKAVAEKLGGEAAGFNIKTIQSLISMGVAAASAVTSAITGLSQFF